MAKKTEIAKAEEAAIQSVEQIESLILTIRGKQVILDRDLARLYGVETFRLNEQVKRNIERFPEDFMFQLTKEEFEDLRSQIVISSGAGNNMSSQIAITSAANMSSQNAITSPQRRPKSALPYAFTENGIAMLSGVLRSPMAIATNIHIMRAFNAMRHFIGSHAQVFQRLEIVERNQLALTTQVAENNKKIEEVFKRLDEGDALPKEAVFFNGEFFPARVVLEKIVKSAKKRVIIVDAYIDAATFEMLDVRAKGVKADIYSGINLSKLQKLHNDTAGVEPIDTHIWKNASHDRWIIADDNLYHCGPSLKDAGQKLGAVAQFSLDVEDILKHIR